MSRYIVRIVGPAGRETYLCRGREVSRVCATHYSSPSAAHTAMLSYYDSHRWMQIVVSVVDLRDPERRL